MGARAVADKGRNLDVDGVATNIHDQGSGQPLLLLHGSGPGVTAWANWGAVFPRLAETARVVAPDLVGFGYTQRPESVSYELDTWVAHVLGVLDALEIGCADVCGNSFGGGVALAFAIRHPDRVRRLVLMGSIGLRFEITPALDTVWGYQPSEANMRELLGLLAFNSSLITEELVRARYEASVQPGVQQAYEQMFPRPRQKAIEAMASSEQAIGSLPHETMILHGREDNVIPPEVSWRLAQLIPRAQFHLFGRCGHWVQIEHARRFVALLSDFLRE